MSEKNESAVLSRPFTIATLKGAIFLFMIGFMTAGGNRVLNKGLYEDVAALKRDVKTIGDYLVSKAAVRVPTAEPIVPNKPLKPVINGPIPVYGDP
jgi:hypothetical protein